MKKLLTALLCAILAVLSAIGFTACGGFENEINVYMPDGAPALSMAEQMAFESDFGENVNYNVVNATVIQTYVTGENPAADVCVLPVNLASKLLGNGKTYKMLGTVTHGNLYIMKKQNGEDITADNLTILVGKTVGVVNLADVPGLTFRLILKDKNIEYNVLSGGSPASDKVNLKALNAEEVLPSAECDYFVVAEPMASAKQKGTQGKLSIAGSLQNLYGAEGYPQAVLVAKNSVIENKPQFIARFMQAMSVNSEWLNSTAENYLQTIVDGINAHVETGSVSALNANNLTAQVIKNCAVNFVPSEKCYEEVNKFLSKLIAVNSASAAQVSESFYYIPNSAT